MYYRYEPTRFDIKLAAEISKYLMKLPLDANGQRPYLDAIYLEDGLGVCVRGLQTPKDFQII